MAFIEPSACSISIENGLVYSLLLYRYSSTTVENISVIIFESLIVPVNAIALFIGAPKVLFELPSLFTKPFQHPIILVISSNAKPDSVEANKIGRASCRERVKMQKD